MSDFRKVFCVYHPQQFITNFCKDPNCLMPLCPSCIGSHNSYHDQSGFRASYLNIFDSLTEVQTLIYDLLVNLEQDKKRNDQILYQIRNLPLLVHQKIVAAKNMVYNGLERAFEELEREVVDGLDRKHEEVGVFARSKVERIHAQLVEGIAELYEMTQNLKTERCLAGMIRFYSEKQAELGNVHSQVTAALYANENYVPMIEVNQEVIGNIAAMVGRLVNVQYSFPKQIEATTYKETAGTKYGNASQVRRFPPPPPPVILPPTPIIVQQQARTITPPRSRPYPSMTASTPTPAAQSSYYQPHQNQYNPQPQQPQPQQQQSTSYQSSHHYQPSPPPPPSNPPRNKTPVRQTVSPKKYNYLSNSNYDEQFESLSRKVREIRRENEMLSKPFKNY